VEGHQGLVNDVCAVTVARRQLLASIGDNRRVRIWAPATSYAQALIRVGAAFRICTDYSQGLQKLKSQHLGFYGGWGSRVSPVWARNPSMRAGRYWIRLSRFLMIAAS
jgi:hypothetical protein